jgi:hypothetical protein
MNYPPMTWSLLRSLIAAGVRFGPTVLLADGTYCGRCGAQIRVVDSACWCCRGMPGPPYLEIVETKRKVTE